MLNGEKFKKEIERVSYDFAVTKNNEFTSCGKCSNCIFDKSLSICTLAKIKWLLEEYKDPILDDKGKNYIKLLVSPFRVDDIVTIVKHSINNELRYELIVNLVHAKMFVYFDRESAVAQMLAKIKSNHSYNAKELGLC